MKYMDMAITTTNQLVISMLQQASVAPYQIGQKHTVAKINACYWDIYDMANQCILKRIQRIFIGTTGTTARIYGTANNRVENLHGSTFKAYTMPMVLNYSKTNWKTAKMTGLVLNEHLNMYSSVRQSSPDDYLDIHEEIHPSAFADPYPPVIMF
jgi:hypothetical protein